MEELKKQKNEFYLSDKDYFSMVPHYITDNSSANSQALYLQMKRYAGEDGVCFATEETLMNKLKIGKKAFNKARDFLLLNKWIKYIGKKSGKTRPINSYRMIDIWDMNHEHYEKISAERNISNKYNSYKKQNTYPRQHKINLKSNVEEEPLLRKTIKEEVIISPEIQENIKNIKETINANMGKIKKKKEETIIYLY